MPVITIPHIIMTERAREWAEKNLHDGANCLMAAAQGELITEFQIGTPDPVIENVMDILFHTFKCGKDNQEFILSPKIMHISESDTGHGLHPDDEICLDICERKEMEPLKDGPLKDQRISIPV